MNVTEHHDEPAPHLSWAAASIVVVCNLVVGLLVYCRKPKVESLGSPPSDHSHGFAGAVASGIMIAASVFHLLPEAVEVGEGVFTLTMQFVFVIGLFTPVILRMASNKTSFAILGSEVMCNITDGILIASTFSACEEGAILGWITMLAVLAHELPHEACDVLLLTNAGMSKRAALLWNTAVSMAIFVGVAIILALPDMPGYSRASLLTYACGNLLGLATLEIIPNLLAHFKKDSTNRRCFTALFFVLGFVLISTVVNVLPQYECAHGHHEEEHGH